MINSAQLTPSSGRVVRHRTYVAALAAQALSANGVRKSLTTVQWDIAARCERPVTLEVEGRVDALRVHDEHPSLVKEGNTGSWYFRDVYEAKGHRAPIAVMMEMRCRRCGPCLRQRARTWRIRAESEILAAPRTWFGTLTLAQGFHARMRMQADQRCSHGGTSFASLSDDERFREIVAEVGKEVTKWIKRVRKQSGARLRYYLVVEKHKSGQPHMHILVHELRGGGSVQERTLRKQWNMGFTKFNLVHDKRTAAYVSKYLAKSSVARVRASLHYGEIYVRDIVNFSSRANLPPSSKYFSPRLNGKKGTTNELPRSVQKRDSAWAEPRLSTGSTTTEAVAAAVGARQGQSSARKRQLRAAAFDATDADQ